MEVRMLLFIVLNTEEDIYMYYRQLKVQVSKLENIPIQISGLVHFSEKHAIIFLKKIIISLITNDKVLIKFIFYRN